MAAPAAGADPLPGQVVINEIHYHPVTDNEEFLELHNPGDEAVVLDGACFTSGIGGCFPAGTTLPAGGFVVAAQSLATYATAFPTAPVPALQYTGSLSNGGEAVTISSAAPAVLDTVTYADASPWPMTPDGDGPSLELADPLGPNTAADAWRASDPAPTPGVVNSQYGQGPGPAIDSVSPGPVAAGDPLPFTAVVANGAAVELEVTVDFEDPETFPMLDDGAHGDGAAGDGTFGVTVPGVQGGTLVRYRVRATNASGTASLPADGSTRPRFGLVVDRPPVDTTIPVVDWYIDPDLHAQLLADPWTNTYVSAVVAVDDEVWDGAEVRISGNGRNPAKYSYKFKMPKGNPLTATFLEDPVDEFVLDGDLHDPTGVVTPLAASVYAATNPLVAQTTKVHVEQNGSSFGLFNFTEEYDKLWRERHGLEGAGDEQYEPEDIVGVFADDGSAAAVAARYEKVAPDDADFTRAYELIRAIDAAPTPARMAQLRDLFDVPALIEALAVGAIVQHWDTTVHNYELLREGSTGRWRILPVDYDLTFRAVEGLFPFGPDNLVSALRSDPQLAEMYLRRVRTLADRYLASGELRERLGTMAPVVAAEQAADVIRWPRSLKTQAQGIADVEWVLSQRTKELLTTRRTADEVPAAPTPGAPIAIVSARYAGDGGAARDAVRLRNPSTAEAVDLSGWRLEGAGTATLPPGTVVPAGGDLVVPTDVVASAGDRFPGTFVAGALESGLDDAGGSLQLLDTSDVVRGQAVLADLVPVAPPGATGLAVEASADQVETLAVDGVGVKLTVAVTNHGPGSATGVKVTGAGTTCGRSLGTVSVGRTIVFRCTTTAAKPLDRTYRIRATSGSTTVASNRVEVRRLVHATNYWSTSLPNAPKVGSVVLGSGATVVAPVALAPPTAGLPPGVPPVRWLVTSAFEQGRAVPTQGSVVSPTGPATIALTEGVPVRVALAARNGAGTGARSPLTPYLTPRPTVSWPFASPAEQVAGIFEAVDGRAPTTAELNGYLGRLQGGEPPAEVIEERLATGIWPTQVEPLVRLYVAYLGRPPDASGLRFWMAQRSKGRTLNSISSSFAASSEFRRSTGGLDDAAFVRFVYDHVLHRSPDAAGLAFWRGRLRSGWTRGRVMTSFSESAEGRTELRPPGPTHGGRSGAARRTPHGDRRPAGDRLAARRRLVRHGDRRDPVVRRLRGSRQLTRAGHVERRVGPPLASVRPHLVRGEPAVSQYKVAIIMGSPNDRPKMEPAAETLAGFGIEADVQVMSAHRTPAKVAAFVGSARENGYAAVIAGAGMAAHLAGAAAAHTTLPVIGVPLSGGALNGVDALYATVQMPKGIPVATVAVDGAINAALLVVQMLAISDADLESKLVADREARASVS
ncbi:5-(carboxyamino)imidazole ribonucleotide mutase [Aquihabitans daechungensis]|uniref:5-(carboxyamino)imidazole ribonucleotide mutase n=1 Tax=Aquihabitans daechungensis TaxID=1052257 RepID=UPI003BA05FF9